MNDNCIISVACKNCNDIMYLIFLSSFMGYDCPECGSSVIIIKSDTESAIDTTELLLKSLSKEEK